MLARGGHEVVTVPEFSYGEPDPTNALIQGENSAVLDDLHGDLTGEVRCIYIDPPYNNNERYTHYDDAVEHEDWLRALEERLLQMHALLREDGSLWISIDDTEMHYLKVVADGVFGRANFVATIVWQHRTSRENRRVFSNNHEYVLVYARSAARFKATRNLVEPSADVLARYKNPDDDPRGSWQSVSATAQAGHATPAQFYPLAAPNGRIHHPPKGRCWVYAQPRMQEAIERGEIWFGRDGNGVPRIKRYLALGAQGLTPETLWTAEFAGTTRDAKRHLLDMFPNDLVFDTPKPETLIRRVLEIATDPGDLVLDPYLGSGTTSAVAHKLGRRWVGIEQGEHAVTHCASRLRMVVDGEAGGISPQVGWAGGGGFSFLCHESRLDPDQARAA
jgi:adenine-specific DNA-methyltransferase